MPRLGLGWSCVTGEQGFGDAPHAAAIATKRLISIPDQKRMRRQRLLLFIAAIAAVTLWTYACGDGTTEPPSDPPRPTTVTVSPATFELAALGATVQLSAQVQDQNGQVISGATVTWASSATAVATVSATGMVTAIASGSVAITATSGSVSGSATVTVAQEVSSVTAAPSEANFAALGDTLRLTAEAFDANGHAVAGAEFSWQTSDDAVATVDATGLATAVANGTATITATAGQASVSATLTVAQEVSSVTVAPAEANLAALGDTLRLTAQAFDANGHAVTGADFLWESSDEAVATVDATGLVTAVANGTATITATAGEASGSATVTVAQVASSVAAAPAEANFTALGDTLRLTAEAFDANGHAVVGAAFSWGTSDDAVATVDATGLVMAVANGTATIMATSGEASATATVTVAQAIVSLAVERVRLVAAQAGKQGADTIVVTALDGGGSPVAGASYQWSTDRHSGWVYPAGGVTDALGRLQSTWVAGWPGEGGLSLIVENNSSRVTQEFATLSTTPTNPPNGALTMLFNHGNSASAGYSLDLTPLSEPTGTYYAAIQWDGGYTGLIRGGFRYDRQLQFSVWDAPGFGSAELIDKASDVVCRTFGAEGTGVACELNYPWRVGSAYRFEITEEEMNGGSAMTLHVTDLATESSRFVGTIRFARRSRMNGFAMFVEDFVQRAQHCLAREVRSAAIRRPRALLDGAWVALDKGTLSRWLVDPWNPGTPGCANLAVRDHAAGLELVIGGETASDPNGSRHFTIPKD